MSYLEFNMPMSSTCLIAYALHADTKRVLALGQGDWSLYIMRLFRLRLVKVLSEMPDPVIHHIEMCVFDAQDTLNRLKKFGFNLFAKRQTASCQQLVARLGTVFYLITERSLHYKPNSISKNVGDETVRTESFTTLCCEESPAHEVDTVFNLAFSVKKGDVIDISERICTHGGQIIQAPTEITEEKNGTVFFSIVKSNCCGNIVHTLINTDDYNGEFLPGFEIVNQCEFSNDLKICGIDHCTLACYSGNSGKVVSFYEECFGMNRFQITSNDDENNGLIISDGVGLRLRAMEYWRCAETGLSYKNKNENSFLLVVVESLQGQTNCNVEEFLRHHKEGIEHIALRSQSIVETVSKLKNNAVDFRNPPRAYYDELRNNLKISRLGLDLDLLSQFGILLDNEDDSADESGGSPEKKYLMQIFAKPLFDLKTFFIEIIQRSGARGLGSGNILALVRSIREEERRNMMKSEAKTQEITKESFTSPRHC
ncbi:4-hydroxyphenylpyruvate dioxygenase-like protein [Araneus ventricosus]|uniref:4-hydroxyphenylpyruvate dioxygenase-like protein n=1 Tax=Araneus ventricosus TaxID=182803 RepID=A0A4Y2BES1_ARAVE|nr:4-hydroxyphenylpyruvate dioxygenase-like protein [Araneus ventricosus]